MMRVTLLVHLAHNHESGGASIVLKMITRNGQQMTHRVAAILGGSPCVRESGSPCVRESDRRRSSDATSHVEAALQAGDATARMLPKSILKQVTPT